MNDDEEKTSAPEGSEPLEEGPPSSKDPMAALLKRSLAPLSAGAASSPSILRGVQGRIRKRSRGKFFADGWSTTDARVSHALIAAAMLLILIIAYFALGPIGMQ